MSNGMKPTGTDPETVRQAILMSMPPEKRQALLQGPPGGPQPGDMGREGDMGPPPIDEAALMQEMQGGMPQMPQPGAGGPPGAPPGPQMPPLPSPAQPGLMARMAAPMVSGLETQGPSPEMEAQLQGSLGAMDGEIQYQNQNNAALMQQMGVSPEQLQAAMAKAKGGAPAPAPGPQGPSMASNPGSKIAQALLKLGM